MNRVDLVIAGGGAAGFFAAIRYAECHPQGKVVIIEKANRLLEKVRISGGGRCNVTHACFDPKTLSEHYPRGERELLGPFHRFMCGDMIAWLEERGVETKIEADGRVFPVTDSSATIIDCFMAEARKLGVAIVMGTGITDFEWINERWRITTTKDAYTAAAFLIATGSSPLFWKLLSKRNVCVVDPVPSLFTFNCKDPLIADLMGVTVQDVNIAINQTNLKTSGAMLITHWGFSGPAVLRLSAWGARFLASCNYRFSLTIDFSRGEDVPAWFEKQRQVAPKKSIIGTPFGELPKRLWERMVVLSGAADRRWAELRRSEQETLVQFITAYRPEVNGKSTFKDEFVTAGGVALERINFKTMEHRDHQRLYFAGEVLDVDAITGGFNFQAAWTTAWIAAESAAAQNLVLDNKY